jgi:O-antigen/teichoic acid export membrane protein
VAHHRQGAVFRIMAVGAALNIALNLVLIPRYSIVGGALSGLLTEALTFVLVWVAMARSAPLSPGRPLLRPVLAAAGLAVILSVLPAWPVLLTVAVGGVSYAVLVFLVGAVHLREIAEIVREQAASPVRDCGD